MSLDPRKPPTTLNDNLQLFHRATESLRQTNADLHKHTVVFRTMLDKVADDFQLFNDFAWDNFADSIDQLDAGDLKSVIASADALRQEHEALQIEMKETEAHMSLFMERTTNFHLYLERTFPRFPELPKEVRLMIWNHAFTVQKIIPITLHQYWHHGAPQWIQSDLQAVTHKSPLFSVDKEAREEAFKGLRSYFHPADALSTLSKLVANFNPLVDILWLADSIRIGAHNYFDPSRPVEAISILDDLLIFSDAGYGSPAEQWYSSQHLKVKRLAISEFNRHERTYDNCVDAMQIIQTFKNLEELILVVERDDISKHDQISFVEPTVNYSPGKEEEQAMVEWIHTIDLSNEAPGPRTSWGYFVYKLRHYIEQERRKSEEKLQYLLSNGVWGDAEYEYWETYEWARNRSQWKVLDVKCVRAVSSNKPWKAR